MQGPSRNAMALSRAALEEALTSSGDAVALAEDLLAVAGTVSGSGTLRRALADPSREGRERAGLVDRLFAGRVGDPAQHVARTVAAQRWNDSSDLPVALEALSVEAFLANAQRAGRLGRVEDELFRFQRIVAGDDRLQAALTDPRAPVASKSNLVRQLLSDKAAPETVRLASHAVATRTERFGRTIESYLATAARRQQQVTAVVTSAAPLTEAQVDRLVAALSRQYGRQVHANIVIDPSVIGGIRVEIGDEVIEGTISSRLDDARRRLSS
ncbi:F0F1 ATP synthase subunit delta [Ornithinimicrobium sediminis]|uniref:F0F1 ATP synthase subunit delta n=1 Tax=Ornithinimicrobium sediminis TaxID=2904603 RepID=UPI001E3FF239|nr:F0F1 ATP synthase subunit delta [Ornithinimicrobium sediminis]MCE0485573.1 F0F1 ATP synthase subunit delta [Ornithinimicrobium sediminis]